MRRITFLMVLTVAAVGVGCGQANGTDSQVQPVETDVTIPDGDKHAFELSGKFSEKISGMSASVRERNGQTTLNLSGVGAGDLTSTRFVFEGKPGTTGTVETVNTAQLSRSQSQYTNSSPLRVSLETYSDSEIVGRLAGKFTHESASGDKKKLDEPIKIEGRFDFEHGN